MFHLTFGERNIWQNTKQSQNIMVLMIVIKACIITNCSIKINNCGEFQKEAHIGLLSCDFIRL